MAGSFSFISRSISTDFVWTSQRVLNFSKLSKPFQFDCLSLKIPEGISDSLVDCSSNGIQPASFDCHLGGRRAGRRPPTAGQCKASANSLSIKRHQTVALKSPLLPFSKKSYNLPSSSTFYPRISTMPDRLYGISGSLQCLNRPQPSNYKVWVSKVCTLSLIIGSSWTDRWYFLNRLLIPINFPPPAICLWVDSSSLPLKRSTSEVIIDISWYLY